MTKRYRVHFRTPRRKGTIVVECDSFLTIGNAVLNALWPPKECPLIVTGVDLLDADSVLKVETEVLNALSDRRDRAA